MEIGKRYVGAGKRKRSSPLLSPLKPLVYSIATQPPYENSLLLHRFPSPSLNWPDNIMARTSRSSACGTLPGAPKPLLDPKRSFTSDYLTNAPLLLDEDSADHHGSVVRSSSSAARTVTPVPSLVFSHTSCSTITASSQPSSPVSVQSCHLTKANHQSPGHGYGRSLSRSNEKQSVTNGLMHKPVGGHTSQASSPCLSTFKYEQYQTMPLTKNVSRITRPLQALPPEAPAGQRPSEVSCIDWDTDDGEDDARFPLSRVNAVFKRGLAEFIPVVKPKPSSPPLLPPRSKYDTIKFGMSVVMENPAAKSPAFQPTHRAKPNTTVKRVFTNPTPPGSRRATSKSDTGHWSTVVGCESIYQLSNLSISHPSENPSASVTTYRDSQSDESVHRTKRRRLSKISHWVKRRVSGSSK